MELQSHLEHLEEQLLQQQQLIATPAASPSITRDVPSINRQGVTPATIAKYGDNLSKLLSVVY